jgi:hypothetical protein
MLVEIGWAACPENEKGCRGKAPSFGTQNSLQVKTDKQQIEPSKKRVNAIPRGASWRRLSELRKVMGSAARASALWQWATFGFLAGNALSLHHPGRYWIKGRQLHRKWPEATVDAALGPAHSPARMAIEALVDRHGSYIEERILEAIEEGMAEGARWTRKRRLLVSAQEAAKRLGVDLEERTDFELRSIGAVDSTREILVADAKDRKRERDRLRMAEKRLAAGAEPRAVYEQKSLSQTKPWEALGVSRRTWERRRKAAVASPSPHIIETSSLLEIGTGDGLASRQQKAIEISSTPSGLSSSPSSGKGERSEPTDGRETQVAGDWRRFPAPLGADGARPELSLSERALIAVIARAQAAGLLKHIGMSQ